MFKVDSWESTPKFKDFNYWFRVEKSNYNRARVYKKTEVESTAARIDGAQSKLIDQRECTVFKLEEICECIVFQNDIRISSDTGLDAKTEFEIRTEFADFKERPEYIIWADRSACTPKELYESYLVYCAFTRFITKSMNKDGYVIEDVDKCWDRIKKCIDWVRSTDFFQAPSSTRYHDAYPGGLCFHTLKVVENIITLATCAKWKQITNLSDAILVALVHDWCKIGFYDKFMRNVKNESTGQWESVPSYKVKDDTGTGCFGHGVTSLVRAQSYFGLSNEEALAIRWHMGEYNVADNEMNDLHRANENFPMVQLLQFADRLSIVNY